MMGIAIETKEGEPERKKERNRASNRIVGKNGGKRE